MPPVDMPGAPVSPVLVGRHRERAALDRLLGAARGNEVGLVLLSGEAGVGKTRLVEETSRVAAGSGMRVLSGHCVQLGAAGLPFAPLVEALRDLARSTPLDQLEEILGPAARLMPRLLPNLAERTGAPIASAEEGSQLLELVLGLIERLAGNQPLLVVLEDLHWADRSTLDLAAFLVQALRGVPVALLFTYRSDELNRRHPLRPLVTGWERMRSVRHLDLPRFDRPAVRDQVTGILGTPPADEVLDNILARSEGNAFLVEELVSLMQGGGDPAGLPPSLRDLLLTRVDSLDEDAQHLLRLAAVAGPAVEETLLLATAGLPQDRVLPSLREAVDSHLLVVDGQGYRFRHALVRDAVYEDMLPGERSRMHAAYGAALAARPELIPDPTAREASSAYHWFAALDLPRALSASVAAGRLAATGFAPSEALTHFERALQLWPQVPDAAERSGGDRVALLIEAADAAHLSGALDRAQALLALALAEVGDGGAPERRATVLERRARLQRDLGRGRAAIEDLKEALRILPAEEDTVLHAATLSSLARLQMLAADAAATRDAGRRAVEAARRVGAPREEAEARITLGVALGWLDELEAGLEELRRGVAIARDGGYPATALRGAINLAHVLEMNGRSAEAAVVAGDSMALAERSGMVRTLGDFLAGNLVESLLHLGEWTRARTIIERGLRTRPEGVYAATLLELRAQLGLLTGRYPEARESIAEARRVLEDDQDYEFVQALTFTTASLLILDGEPDRALALMTRTLPAPGAPSPYAWPLAWLAARTAADLAEAGGLPVDDRIAGWVERMGTGLAPQQAYRAMAQAELRRGAGAATSGEWTAASEQWRALQWPYPLAYSLWRAAEAAASEGDAEAAATTAAEARELADRIGAAPLVALIGQLVERGQLAGRGSGDVERRLTSRELEVLRLLAAGRTSPQIAGELFISPKTASVHVSNILAKLEVGTRVEAAGVAHRLGLLPAG